MNAGRAVTPPLVRTHRNLRGGFFVLSAHRAAMADPALSVTDFLERMKDPRAADLVRGIRT